MVTFLGFFICFLILGAFSGFLAGLFGIGGGMVVVPALFYLLPWLGINSPLQMSIILGTSFATIAITTLASTEKHYKLGNIQWEAAKYLAPTLVLTGYIASDFITKLDKHLVVKIFAVLMVYLAVKMFRSIKKVVQDKKLTPISAIVGGIGIGLAASAAGIGGGGFTVPFLNSRGISIKKAIGTSAFCSMVLGLSSAISYMIHGWGLATLPPYSLGYVYVPAVVGITSASFFTAKLGARMVDKLPVPTLKKCFAGLLIVIAIDMLFR